MRSDHPGRSIEKGDGDFIGGFVIIPYRGAVAEYFLATEKHIILGTLHFNGTTFGGKSLACRILYFIGKGSLNGFKCLEFLAYSIHGAYRFHSGTDLLADPAQPVRAAYDGVVRFSGWNGPSGKQIEVQHDARYTTRYSHLQTLLVGEGRKVKKGEVIGLAGSTGQSTGVHLHFELTRNGLPEDPEDALAQGLSAHPRNETSPGFPRSSLENPRHFEAVTASP